MSYYIKVNKEDIPDTIKLFEEILQCCLVDELGNERRWNIENKIKGKYFKISDEWAVGIHGPWCTKELVWLRADTSTTNWKEVIVERNVRRNKKYPANPFMAKVYIEYLSRMEMKKLSEKV